MNKALFLDTVATNKVNLFKKSVLGIYPKNIFLNRLSLGINVTFKVCNWVIWSIFMSLTSLAGGKH